ncbi:MAG TPA: 3'-5' exonuclease [Balneolaceae bacterium]|nr:3'-5' exonuclease [Balneolaceae bacterium]
MLEHINIADILFLDIETVPEVYKFEDLDEARKDLWDTKMKYKQKRNGKTAGELYDSAGILAEFGKIVCISAGAVNVENGKTTLRLKSFCGHDETELLSDFNELLNDHYSAHRHLLCAHNGKEFDFPYLARRLLINGLPLPSILDIAGKKPWEVRHLDTMELWKFGDYKHYTSLNLLTHIFNIPSPKSDISGADVSRVYWEENDLKRIAAYCEKDVQALAQLFCRYRGEPLIEDEDIVSV